MHSYSFLFEMQVIARSDALLMDTKVPCCRTLEQYFSEMRMLQEMQKLFHHDNIYNNFLQVHITPLKLQYAYVTHLCVAGICNCDCCIVYLLSHTH